MQRKVLLCLIGVLCPSSLSWGVPLYVDARCGDDAKAGTSPNCADADGPKLTIQAAVDIAVDNDEVIVAPGTYLEAIEVGKSITLRSSGGAASTMIDATGLGSAAAVFADLDAFTPSIVIQGFTITNGDGIGVLGNAGGTLAPEITVDECTFIGNSVGADSVDAVTHSRFVGNDVGVATSFFDNTGPRVVNSLFSGNGCGLCVVNGAYIHSCTFGGNETAVDTGIGGSAFFQVTNSIVGGGQIRLSSTTVTFSNIQGGHVGTGNINVDPLFVDPDGADDVVGTADDDLRLQAGSPCIDAGNNAGAPATDLDGNPRLIDDPFTPDTGNGTPPIVDMGAYEVQDVPCTLDDECDDDDVCNGQEFCSTVSGICEPGTLVDCNDNGVLDECDLADETSLDCNDNLVPDECDLDDGTSTDCNANAVPDSCDIAASSSSDCNADGIPDECELVAGGIFNPATGNWYRLTGSAMTWPEAEAEAVASGGHLVAIGSAAENQWLADTFPNQLGVQPWIGFTDSAVEGVWVWSNGEPVVYTNWALGEPNNANNEDYAEMYAGGKWNDARGTRRGLIESSLNAADCNGNTVLDECDLANGTSSDCNGNGVPDECEVTSPSVAALPDGGNGSATRHLAIQAGDVGRSQAIRVTFDDLAGDYAIWNGTQMWVQAPQERCEHAGTVSPPCPGGTSYQAATLGCSPLYMDWSTVGTVYVEHEGIIPFSSYTVEVVDGACPTNDPASYSPALPMYTSKLGDCCGSASADPPNGAAGLRDVLAVLKKFANDPGAPIKARLDHAAVGSVEDVDHMISLPDVLAPLHGFANVPYPGTPSAADLCPAAAMLDSASSMAPSSAAAPVEAAIPVDPERIASLRLASDRTVISPGGLVTVDVFVDHMADMQGYQLALEATGGTSGAVVVEGLWIDSARPDHAFDWGNALEAIDSHGGRLLAVQMNGGTDIHTAAYLASFQLRASDDASGEFNVDLRWDETLLMTPNGQPIHATVDDPAKIRVEPKAFRRAER